MDRLNRLADRLRRYTHNQSFTDSAILSQQLGLQTQTIIDFFNEGEHVLHGLIYRAAPELYIKTDTIDIVANQEAYDLPLDAFLGSNIISIEYKYGTGDRDYTKLKRSPIHERGGQYSGVPSEYVLFNNQILISPVPSSNLTAGIRVTYEEKKARSDVRRGKVSAVDSGSAPTSITLTSGTDAQMVLAFGGDNDPEYITLVDKDGVVQMANIPVTAYDSTTRIITLDTFTPLATELAAVGNYVVVGSRSTTHPDFPDFCESFLLEYAKHAIMELEGHPGASAAAQKLRELTDQIVDVFADIHADLQPISEINPFRSLDDWGQY